MTQPKAPTLENKFLFNPNPSNLIKQSVKENRTSVSNEFNNDNKIIKIFSISSELTLNRYKTYDGKTEFVLSL